ncbi:alpha/beta fold hydrolase [Caulobacter sp. ErkDOM-E]|uniref:alpha/beta fold hydrolase n=1 Tax=Caulobacter sp. ErkDOM-E TaxID=3402778 RepID=UPI003AF87212
MTGRLNRLATRLDTAGAIGRMRRHREGWPARASEGVRFFQSPKVQYRYREAGKGQTIVFSVDPPMTLEVYDALIATFAQHFRVIAFELPAMGFSAAAEDYRFGFRETHDDLAIFLKAVAGSGAILAFSCVAGHAALDIAARYPDLVSRLTLLQAGDVAAFKAWKAARDPKGILAKPILGHIAMRRMAPKRMPAWYGLSVGKKEMIGDLCRCAERSFQHGAQWSLASAYQCYMDPDVELPRAHQPLLSIWGAADRSHPAGNAHSIQRLRPDAACVTFDDLGHTPELEDPQRVFAAIVRFCEANPARP